MTVKEKQLFAAVEKMNKGREMYEEGRAELRSLLGERLRKVVGEADAAFRATAKARKMVAHRAARRGGRRRSPMDKLVLEKVLESIKTDRWATVLSIANKTKISSYSVNRAIDQLRKSKRIVAQWRTNNPQHTDARTKNRSYRYWQAVTQ